MAKNITPYKSEDTGKKEQVTKMFDNIAGGYDFLNRLLSARFDVSWRNKLTALILAKKPEYIMDMATGTADVAITLAEKSPSVKVKGIDISKNMLKIGQKKVDKKQFSDRITLQWGDAENIKEEDATFDITTASFGVRNFEDLKAGLKEMYRVTRPGGHIFVLEFSKPNIFPLKQLYNFYFQKILPVIGRLRSKDPKAYTYLYESVQAFPDRKNFLGILQEIGFNDVGLKELTWGICHIYYGKK
ncbi:bifunctional demethylmenaquinone methyltransferase/2-methoxy-6-polyprenyl-1,4-benzoquinol methylase UbiE [Membranihabitans maritimus]|uniref:bifunctional demethylmenaquinone methyltransferase/2-methoxy-6-polyprenyl-1,4-benzoquinol methylase UbiE n=1 Tax=Membranihabitans maritimus TaxID=2904244 RepID=UPI001F01EB79|nr:bifunctional demethylmenaquinone methyltransferase/2-methoxy-6-polyprenyl-1,4-benzoquinol methylase UbiE [Membranihabitans maritimus]